MLVTRIAPTPSGLLHPGNAVNFLLTSWLARQHGGRLLLRIDDMDAGRVRTPYLEDIFRVLDWLDLQIDGGPSGVADFQRRYSMAHRTDRYRQVLEQLGTSEAGVFACCCSRRDLAGRASARYPGTCRTRHLPWQAGQTALRLAVPIPCEIGVGGAVVDVAREMGDFVLWRRDDLPAYQLASVVEDHDLGVTAIVRGLDLLPSSAAQLYLARLIGAADVAAADIRHHALLRGADGLKLSKSTGSRGSSMAGDRDLLRWIRGSARSLAPSIGIEPG